MPTTPIKCLSLCDLIDFVARLKAAEAVIIMLVSNGLQVDNHIEAINALSNYQQLLEHEASEKMRIMENERKRGGHDA